MPAKFAETASSRASKGLRRSARCFKNTAASNTAKPGVVKKKTSKAAAQALKDELTKKFEKVFEYNGRVEEMEGFKEYVFDQIGDDPDAEEFYLHNAPDCLPRPLESGAIVAVDGIHEIEGVSDETLMEMHKLLDDDLEKQLEERNQILDDVETALEGLECRFAKYFM